MHINITDIQTVGESEAPVFTLLAQGIDSTVFMLTNAGMSTINYRFQANSGTSWIDIGAAGTDTYSTLMTDQTRTIKVTTQYPSIRLLANADGGSVIQFSIVRPQHRPAGGSIPIVGF